MTSATGRKLKAAVIGSGNIGTDLMVKILRYSSLLEMAVLVGIDPSSEGIARARQMGVVAIAEGLDGLLKMPLWKDIDIVFDATSAAAHGKHNDVCVSANKVMIDLTPAAIGPYVIPEVNGDAYLDAPN